MSYNQSMFGLGKKKDDGKMLNPKLGIGAKVISGITILIFYGGIQEGIIGGIIGGTIAFGFYNLAIKQLAKHKKVDLMVDKLLPTKEEIEKVEKSSKARIKFWTIFLSVCGAILLLTFILVRLSQ